MTSAALRRLLAAATCAGCFGSVLYVVLAARAAGSAGGSPIEAPGAWGSGLLPAVVAGFVLYVAAAWLADDTRIVAAFAVATQLVPLFGPLLLTTDARTYGAYGELALHGRNPYVYASPDNLFPSVYGPLFTLVSEPVSWALGSRAQLGFRVLAALSILAATVLAALLVRRRALAVALIGLNPLVALHCAGGGHNDALMVALALGGLVLARRGRTTAAGVLWAASVFVKWISGVLYLLLLVARRGRGLGLAAFAFTCVALAAVATAVYGIEWLHAGATLVRGGGRYGSIGLAHWLDDAGLPHRVRVVVVDLVQLGALAFLAWRAWTGRLRLGLAAGLLAILQSWLNPWYAIWAVGFAAADERDRAGRVLAVALSGYLLLDVAPH